MAREPRKRSLLQRPPLMCIIKDLSPPLLPGPKATIVCVVVIDIVFHPYNTKQSDHDSDANAEVERVFLMSRRADQRGSWGLEGGYREEIGTLNIKTHLVLGFCFSPAVTFPRSAG